jgi:hypothetical protein
MFCGELIALELHRNEKKRTISHGFHGLDLERPHRESDWHFDKGSGCSVERTLPVKGFC